MNLHNRRWPAILAGLSMLLTLPAESHAGFCDLFKCKSCQAPAQPMACNACAQPQLACNPCAQAQTVSYVPQTSYRCQSITVPVTSYQPVTSSDPCSGCPVTSYRPVTSYVQQRRMVPYTSYRLVYSNRPCVTCAPAMATTTYIPSTTYVPTTNYQAVAPAAYNAPAACPTCPGGTASYGAATAAPSLLTPPSYGAPSYGAAPGYGAPQYSSPSAMPAAPGAMPPGYSQPGSNSTFATPPQAAAPTTSGYAAAPYYNPGYPGSAPASGASAAPGASQPSGGFNPPPPANYQNTAPAGGTQQGLKPIPDQNMNQGSKINSSSNLRLLDPDNRTTSAPAYPAGAYTAVAWASAATQTSTFENNRPEPVNAPAVSEEDSWRPSNR